jgi:hypothetical protein
LVSKLIRITSLLFGDLRPSNPTMSTQHPPRSQFSI